jgi:hypothetical protein
MNSYRLALLYSMKHACDNFSNSRALLPSDSSCYEILFRNYEILFRKNEMLVRNYEIIIRKYEIIFCKTN